MSIHVCGFKPPDEKWEQMKAVYDACIKAKIDPPKEVEMFFCYEEPDPSGVKVNESQLRDIGALKEHRLDSVSGFEIDITKLPKDIKFIRFYNCW